MTRLLPLRKELKINKPCCIEAKKTMDNTEFALLYDRAVSAWDYLIMYYGYTCEDLLRIKGILKKRGWNEVKIYKYFIKLFKYYNNRVWGRSQRKPPHDLERALPYYDTEQICNVVNNNVVLRKLVKDFKCKQLPRKEK